MIARAAIVAAALALAIAASPTSTSDFPGCDPNAGECPGIDKESDYPSHESYAVAMGWRTAYLYGECNNDWWQNDHMSGDLAQSLTERCYELGLNDQATTDR